MSFSEMWGPTPGTTSDDCDWPWLSSWRWQAARSAVPAISSSDLSVVDYRDLRIIGRGLADRSRLGQGGGLREINRWWWLGQGAIRLGFRISLLSFNELQIVLKLNGWMISTRPSTRPNPSTSVEKRTQRSSLPGRHRELPLSGEWIRPRVSLRSDPLSANRRRMLHVNTGAL